MLAHRAQGTVQPSHLCAVLHKLGGAAEHTLEICRIQLKIFYDVPGIMFAMSVLIKVLRKMIYGARAVVI